MNTTRRYTGTFPGHTPGQATRWQRIAARGTRLYTIPATRKSFATIRVPSITAEQEHLESNAMAQMIEERFNGYDSLAAQNAELAAALRLVRDYVVTMKGAGHTYQIEIDAALSRLDGAKS